MKHIALVSIIGVMLISCASLKVDSGELKRNQTQVGEKLTSQTFRVEPHTLITSKGMRKDISSGYYLTIKGDSVYSHLPFWGKAYTAPVGHNGGIELKTTYKNYEVKANKKGDGWHVQFEVSSQGEWYNFILSIYYDGSCTLDVSSSRRSAISYFGNLKEP